MAKRGGAMESVGAILGRYLGRRGGEQEMRLYALRSQWPEIVGEKVAGRAVPTALRHGVLTLTVQSSAWLNELSYMRVAILEQIRRARPEAPVQALRLVAGPVRQARARPRPEAEQYAYVELPPNAVAEVDRDLAEVEDTGLRRAIRRARLAQLARALRFDREDGR